MTTTEVRETTFEVDEARRVSGLFIRPPGARVVLVLAHGAGAGMTHPFMEAIAAALGERGVATLRYQFPYMERGGGRPDQPNVAQATVRAAVAEAARLAPRLPLFAGGKSFGGRMTSQAAAEAPLPGVQGIVFLGFPLHAPGRPADSRGDHLADVTVPLLFVQGTRDDFADLTLLQPLIERLGRRAILHRIEGGNHSFALPAKSGRTAGEIRSEIAVAIADWTARL